MIILRNTAYAAIFVQALLLAGCNDLTRSEAARILDNEGRGHACVSTLDFNEGGFERAKAAGVFSRFQGGLIGSGITIADTADGDQWHIACLMGMCGGIARKNRSNLCIPGRVEVLTLADPPFVQNNGSYKTVEFTEIVDLPPELKRMEQYVYTRYKKSVMFQKTDAGWRVAQ
jgi:hypothetical protein